LNVISFQELRRRNVHRAAVFYAGAAWLLVQIATQVFPFFHVDEWVVRWIVVAAVIGFPFALLFSWFYEWTPQGIKLESEIDRNDSVTRATGKAMDRWIIAVLSLAVVALLSDRLVLHREAAAPINATVTDKSIAVLPLANSTGDPSNDYFSDGVSEELISSLSRLSSLKVVGRTSSFQFRNSSDSSRTIGEKLGVVYLLEGSVRKSADRVRIAVALVKSADGANVWSETYDRELKDIFAVQSEIAASVAEQLKIALLGNNAQAVQTPTAATPSNGNVEAYNALLLGNYYFARRTREDFSKAIASYQEAIRLDPDYALAWARLSSTLTLMATTLGANADEIRTALIQAREAVDTALRLAPDLGQAHFARGMLLQNGDLDWSAADAEFQRAAELLPQDALMLNSVGFRLAGEGRFDEAAAAGRRAMAVDPLFGTALYYLARALTGQGAYDEAEAALHKAIDLQPQGSQSYMQLAVLQILRGHPAAAVDLAKKETNPFWRNYALSLAYFANGEHQQAEAQLKQLIAENADSSGAQIAMVYALRKEPDKMFEWLERARVTHDPGVFLMRVDPFLSAYKNDPRYEVFCRKIALPGPGAAQ
jgi:TolB-like protein/Tfp pilus assembly protein PilF